MTRLPRAHSVRSRRFRTLLLSGVLLLQALLAVSQAQITLDGSLGPRAPLTGPHYRIGAELGQLRGGNLFHSFGEFNVPTGGSATFTGPNTIANIVGRVTGGQPSAIDGVLRSEIAGANLFLLNPSGVLFGPHASLAVSGSFHVSTADYLRFADGAKFFATLGSESVLTVASPAAFGFLGNTPAPITIQGSTLQVPPGKALSVVGGDMTIVGNGPLTAASVPTLGAPRGLIQLASVASPGEVVFSRLELAPDLQVDSLTRRGRLELSRGAFLDASGNGGGIVLLRSGRLRVDGSWIFADNLGPVDGSGLGVDLRVADDATVTNGSLITTDSLGTGRARDLQLNVGTLTLTGGAQISSTARGAGRGGTVTLTATDSVALSGRGSDGTPSFLGSLTIGRGEAGSVAISAPTLSVDDALITAATLGAGRAGDMEITVGRLTLTGGALIDSSSFGDGRGGKATITATDSITLSGRSREGLRSRMFSNAHARGDAGRLFIAAPTLHIDAGRIQAATAGDGNAGSIDVRVERLVLTGGAQINTGVGTAEFRNGVPIFGGTGGPGRGGDMTVVATDSMAVAGRDSEGFPSGLFSNAQFGRGRGGNISISTPTLTMDDGGAIATNTLRASSGDAGNIALELGRLTLTGGAAIGTLTEGVGRGGHLTVAATDLISIAGQTRGGVPSGLFSDTRGSGQGGSMDVQARTIELSNGGIITASSSSVGDAGTILLQAGETFRSQHGGVTTATAGAGGGAIALTAGRLVQLRDSALTTSVRGGGGDAGNLTLTAPFIIAEGSQIVANAFEGMGGNIRLGAEVFLADPVSLVSASSALGISGIVDIRAPVTTLSGTLAPLPQVFVSAAALLPARCVARWSGGKASSLVLGGRDGPPSDPSGVLSSPLVMDTELTADPAMIGVPPSPPAPAKVALLAGQEKALPRLQGGRLIRGCPK
jgi:filamentous hemagglutinin family protein